MFTILSHAQNLETSVFPFQIFYKERPELFYRHSPSSQSCVVELVPERFDRVTIKTSKFALNGNNLSVNLSWTFPGSVYGQMRGYDVRFTLEPLSLYLEQAGNDQLVLQRAFEVSQLASAMLFLLLSLFLFFLFYFLPPPPLPSLPPSLRPKHLPYN